MIAGLAIKPKPLVAEDKVPLEFIEPTKEELVKKVYKYSKEYQVDPKIMIAVMNCENKEWDTDLQSRIINKQGVREKSYGLSQIHLPSNPSITKEQATDPDFSISFMAEKLSQGRGNMWTCYRKLNA